MARGFHGVRADLSELARHIVDIACFLSPLVHAPTHADSPPPSPRPPSRVLAGILADFAEISGGLRSGLSRLSTIAFRKAPTPPDRDRGSRESRVGGVSEEVVEFVTELVECPESWLEFPVPVDDDSWKIGTPVMCPGDITELSDKMIVYPSILEEQVQYHEWIQRSTKLMQDFLMSHPQREHISTVERLVPSITALRISLCPTYMSEECFWKIYFALLHPRLNKHDMERLSTQQIVDSMRIKLKEMQHRVDAQSLTFRAQSFPLITSGSNMQLEDDQAQEASAITKITSQQSMHEWSEVPSEVGDTTDGEKQSRTEDFSFRERDDGSIVLMERYIDQLLVERGQLHSPSSSHQQDQLRKPIPVDNYNKAIHHAPQMKIVLNKESGDWHAVEDFDFEVVERPSAEKIM